MRWSRLKQKLEERFAEPVRGRVEAFETLHRNGHHHRIGEFWLTVDKERIFTMGEPSAYKRMVELEADPAGLSWTQVRDQARAEGALLLSHLNEDLFGSLNMPIEEMLTCKNPIIRGFAILDSRCGKRRLASFDHENEHELVQHLFALRACHGQQE